MVVIMCEEIRDEFWKNVRAGKRTIFNYNRLYIRYYQHNIRVNVARVQNRVRCT